MNWFKVMNQSHYQIMFSILLLALFLRIPLLGGSFWLDEAAQALESSRPLSQQLDISYDFQPPLYHLVVHMLSYFGSSEWWLRLASLVPGLISVFVTIKIATFKSKQSHLGYTAGALLATSQFHVFYSQELRPYAFAAMWGVVSTYALINWLDSSKRLSFAYILATMAGMLSVYTYGFLVFGQMAYVFWVKREVWRSYLWQLVLVGAPLTLWLPAFWQQWQRSVYVSEIWQGWAEAVSFPVFKAFPLSLAKLFLGRIPFGLDLHTLVLCVLIGVPVVILIFSGLRYRRLRGLLLLSLVPLGLATIFNPILPTLEPKRYLVLLPLLYVFMARASLKFSFGRVLIGFMLIGNLFGLGMYYTDTDLQRESWRELVATIEQEAGNSSASLFAFEQPFAPWVWYSTGVLEAYAVLPTAGTVLIVPDQLLGYEHIYVFDYLMDLTDPERVLEEYLLIQGYEEIGFVQYPHIGKVKHMSRQAFFADTAYSQTIFE